MVVHYGLYSSRAKQASPLSTSGKSHMTFGTTCQWCGKEWHTTKKCHKLKKLLKKAKVEGLIEAFVATSLDDSQDTEWYTDIGATSHMTNDVNALDKSVPYTSNQRVVVGNGHSLSLSHIGSISSLFHSHPLKISGVLFVPHITRNLLSISKLDIFFFWFFYVGSSDKNSGGSRALWERALYSWPWPCKFSI